MSTIDIANLLEAIDSAANQGNRRQLTQLLRELKENRVERFKEAMGTGCGQKLAQAILKILLLELDEEEEESIELAELAYVACSYKISQPEEYKTRVLLLHYFYDYFTDSVITIFLDKYRETDLLQARTLAAEAMQRMQLHDLYAIETIDAAFVNNDAQLIDAGNELTISPEITPQEMTEATTMHKVIFAYLAHKYK
ncbi:MAG: hypothetical protein ACRDDZ_13010 [Marinifilaceae bacterium]